MSSVFQAVTEEHSTRQAVDLRRKMRP